MVKKGIFSAKREKTVMGFGKLLSDEDLEHVSGGTDEDENVSEEAVIEESAALTGETSEKKMQEIQAYSAMDSETDVDDNVDDATAFDADLPDEIDSVEMPQEVSTEMPQEVSVEMPQESNTDSEPIEEVYGLENMSNDNEDNYMLADDIEATPTEDSFDGDNIEVKVAPIKTDIEDAPVEADIEIRSDSGMIVHNNMAAINTLTQLSKNQGSLSKISDKLSSGMKINSAADDPSGYQIAERMRVQVRSLDQANYNAQNGRSMMKVEEGAVDSTVETLRTLKEKVINAVNDTNTEVDRESIQKEINESIQQIDDNALLTFNGKFLNNGSRTVNGETTRNVLYTEQQNSDISNELSIMNSVLKERNGNNLDISATDMVEVSYVVNGITYKTEFPAEDLANAMKQVREEQGSVADNLSVEAGETHGTSEPEVINTNDNGESIYFTAPANDIDDSLTSISNGLADKNSEMKSKVNSIIDSFEEEISARNESEDNSVAIQIGANANQRMNLSLEDMRSAALGLSGNGRTVSVSDKTNATASLKVIDNALQRALNQEASIGAVMNRLEFTSNNLTTSSENLQSAESTYRDADMAKEMTEFTKNNILMQAATAMLSQANQQNQGILSLLQ